MNRKIEIQKSTEKIQQLKIVCLDKRTKVITLDIFHSFNKKSRNSSLRLKKRKEKEDTRVSQKFCNIVG